MEEEKEGREEAGTETIFVLLYDKRSKCPEDHRGRFPRRRRSPLSLTGRTLSWRRPSPESAELKKKRGSGSGGGEFEPGDSEIHHDCY